MRFCVLFKFSVSAGLYDTALVGKGRCHFVMTGRGESLGFPLGLHRHLGEGGLTIFVEGEEVQFLLELSAYTTLAERERDTLALFLLTSQGAGTKVTAL